MNKSYTIKDSHANKQIIGGFVVLGMGIVLMAISGKVIGLGLGILYLILGFMKKGKELIIFHNEFIELKSPGFGSTHRLKYEEIDKLDLVSEKKVYVHGKVDGNQKKILVPVFLLTPEDKKSFIEDLNTRIK